MNTSISTSSLVSNLQASYQRLAQAQARVQESQQQVSEDRARLDGSQQRLDRNKGQYAQALSQSSQEQTADLQYAVQTGSGTQQVPSTTDSGSVRIGSPTVNSSGQTVGSLISVKA